MPDLLDPEHQEPPLCGVVAGGILLFLKLNDEPCSNLSFYPNCAFQLLGQGLDKLQPKACGVFKGNGFWQTVAVILDRKRDMFIDVRR